MVGPALAAARVEAAARYLHWGVIQISLVNFLMIVAMIVLFVVALVARMPASHDTTATPSSPAGKVSDDAR